MNESIKKLIKLIEEKPNLPVVPLIDSYICEDGYYAQYVGSIGDSWVGKYLLGNHQLHLYDDDPYEMFETASDVLGIDSNESISDEAIQQVYDNLPWILAILVDIEAY